MSRVSPLRHQTSSRNKQNCFELGNSCLLYFCVLIWLWKNLFMLLTETFQRFLPNHQNMFRKTSLKADNVTYSSIPSFPNHVYGSPLRITKPFSFMRSLVPSALAHASFTCACERVCVRQRKRIGSVCVCVCTITTSNAAQNFFRNVCQV